MQTWIAFFALSGGASATLMGLLFVAVSIHAGKFLSDQHKASRRFAEQAFQNYLSVLLVSLLSMFPDISEQLFGAITLSMTAAASVWVLIRMYLAAVDPSEIGTRAQRIRTQYPSLLGFALLIYAASGLALNQNWGGRNTFAAAVMVLMLAGTVVSWRLLVGMSVVAAVPADSK
jgi:hypothetical protein